jgi:hypothetical protein
MFSSFADLGAAYSEKTCPFNPLWIPRLQDTSVVWVQVFVCAWGRCVQEREGGVREVGGEGGRRLGFPGVVVHWHNHTKVRERETVRGRGKEGERERERERERDIPHIVDEGRGQMINIMKFECRTFARLHIHYLPVP